MMDILVVAAIVFFLNLPFGYWRGNVKKFSLQWALAIHIPVPAVIALRFWSDIGFALYTYPILIGAFFGGQYLGGILLNFVRGKRSSISSCMVMDIYRLCTHH